MDLKAKPFCLTEEELAQVNQTLAAMTDDEKLGQLFCVMGGDYSMEHLREMAAHGRIGGVLFRPVRPGAEIKADLDALDAVAKVPLLKAANLEEGGSGGMVDGTLYGWPMLVAASDDVQEARRFGLVCGCEGASIGVNISYSPVSDLDLNYRNPITNVRTFGSGQKRVETFTRAYMEAMQSCGVAACAKHFPGDGVDFRDQHLHTTYNSLKAREWYDSYGKIYENLIDGGLFAVMAGHIAQANVALDARPELSYEEAMMPATLSKTLLTDVLRGRLGFNGLITTDATIMAGFTQAMERRHALPRAIMSGCDMLVFSTDFEEDRRYLSDALAGGELTMERLDEAVKRILALKTALGREYPRNAVPAKQWRRECADKAVTMVKNTQPDKLPMTPERYPNILLIPMGEDRMIDGSVTETAKAYLESTGFAVSVYDWEADDLHGTANLPTDRLTLYITNFEQRSNQTTIRIPWSPKHALNVPRHPNEEVSVFVSLANPYHLQDVPRVRTYINAYTATRDTIELTIDKLIGKSSFNGTSPVDAYCGLSDTRL